MDTVKTERATSKPASLHWEKSFLVLKMIWRCYYSSGKWADDIAGPILYLDKVVGRCFDGAG